MLTLRFPFFRALFGLAMACAVFPVAASDYSLVQELSAIASGDGEPESRFGISVAVDGDLAVAATVGSVARAATIRTYARNGTTWSHVPDQDITLVGRVQSFMSFNEGTLVVSYNDSLSTGAYVQIFRHTLSGWIQEDSFYSTNQITSVATTGSIAAIGRPGYDGVAGTDQGVILILRRQPDGTWQHAAQFPSTPQAGARFGTSVAIVAGAIVVGAENETVTAQSGTYSRAGAAYVYELTQDTWTEVAHLVEPDVGNRTDYHFGHSVAISGADPSTPDRMLIGNNHGTDNVVRSYRHIGGIWKAGFTIPEPVAGVFDNFGCSLAMDGDWAVIGANTSSAAATYAGAILLVKFNSGFTSVGSLTERTDPQASANENFGLFVAIDRAGPSVIAGNYLATLNGNDHQGVVLVGHSQSGEVPTLARSIDLGQGLTDARAAQVAVDGDTVILGATAEAVGIQHERGAAYIYRRQGGGTYTLEARLLAPDGTANDFFGGRVALKGDVALVSATGYSLLGHAAAGAVYAFHRDANAWTLEAQFVSPTPVADGSFGLGLAFDGTTALIGEYAETTTVLQRSAGGTWTTLPNLAHRGWNAQVEGNTAMLGDSLANGNVGEVAIYSRETGSWQPAGTLPGFNANQYFGANVALDGDRVAVTSTSAIAPVQIYRRNGNNWLPDASLLPDDAVANTQCYRAALHATTLAIGCWDPTGSRQGQVYLFDRSSGAWTQSQKLVLSNPQPFDQFGSDLAFDGTTTLFAGAYRRDIDFIDQGAVYVYRGDELFRNGFE